MLRSESKDLLQRQTSAPAPRSDVDDLVTRLKAALEIWDRTAADELLREADAHFPEDSRFPPLRVQLSRLARRLDDFETALGEATAELANELFTASLGRFREALNLGRGVPGLQERAFKTAIERAEELLERNWRIAESLLSEAGKLNSHLEIPGHLWEQIRREQREESINNALNESWRAETNSDLLHARNRLASLLQQHPAAAQIEARLKSIDAELVRNHARDRETRLRTLADARGELDRTHDPNTLRNFNRFQESSLGSYRSDAEFAAILAEVDELASKYREAATALEDKRYAECLESCRKLLSQRPTNRLFLGLQESAEERQRSPNLSEKKAVAPAAEHAVIAVAEPQNDIAPVAQPVPVLGWFRRVLPLMPNAHWGTYKTVLVAAALGLLVLVFFSTRLFRISSKSSVPAPGAEDAKIVTRAAAGPVSARLEIQDALPGTRISLDGMELATIASKEPLAVYITAGSHTVELSRKGFLRKQVNHDFAPGDRLLLAGSAVQLESNDARIAVAIIPRGGHSNATSLLPANAPKTNPESPEQLLSKSQDTLPSGEIRELPPAANPIGEEQFEQKDWDAVDKNNNGMLQAFLTKHPSGHYSTDALDTIASLDRNAKAESRRVEEEAWSAVNPQDRSSLESYARRFPSGMHRGEVEGALANLAKADLLRQESAAVLTVLRQYVNAWNAKDTDSIVALQRGLDRRVVKAQLAPIKSLVMRVSPAFDPQIDGAQATVLCRSQVAEVFSDGVQKKTPETVVTFVLSKRSGAWIIDGATETTAVGRAVDGQRQKM